MNAEGVWRVVDQDQDDLPTLVLRSSFTDDGYTIYLSDLSRIWAESLTKDALIERAHEIGCPIDPGDDAAQYKIFTRKLKSALDQQSGTSLELRSARTGATITLSLSVTLPKPLPALEWEIHLQRNDDLLYSQLTGPLINQTHILEQRVSYLLSELQAKDHVMSRLADRLESSGTPWSDVFPQIANAAGRSRAPGLEKVAKLVPGFGRFDESNWQDRVRSQFDDPVKHVAAVISTLPSASSTSSPGKPHWWGGLNVKIARSLTLSADTASMDRSSPPAEGDTTVVFETQPGEARARQEDGDDSSTDDDDFEVQIPSSPARPEREDNADELTHRPSKKLGTIGGRAQPKADTSVPAEPKAIRAETPPPLPRPKAKLGTLGGKKSTRAKTPEPEHVVETTEAAPSPAPVAKTRKLGTIGGRKKEPTADVQTPMGVDAEEKPPESRQDTAKDTPQDNDIPEEERADHKRDQLKRQLEQQAKAPVKKKRRF